jgi:hypothetical protein
VEVLNPASALNRTPAKPETKTVGEEIWFGEKQA